MHALLHVLSCRGVSTSISWGQKSCHYLHFWWCKSIEREEGNKNLLFCLCLSGVQLLVMTAAAGAGRHLWIAAVCTSLFCSPIILLIEFQEILIRVGSDSCSQMCEDKHRRPNPHQGTSDHLSPTSTLLGVNQTPHMLTADLKHPLHSARLKHNVITTMPRCAAKATNTDSRETATYHMYP